MLDAYLAYLSAHPWHKRTFLKMSPEHLRTITDFIARNGGLTTEPFELAVNRLYIDQLEKPKKWKEISEFLSIYNTWRKTNKG